MRFEIDRASLHDGTKPCKEAFKVKYTKVDRRSTDHPAKIPAHKNWTETQAMDWWLSEGTNHRVVDGQIERDMGEDEMWCVEIASLKDLMAFKEKYDSLVLRTSYKDYRTPAITIYDDYLE